MAQHFEAYLLGLCEWGPTEERSERSELFQLRAALDESVKLQSHYARLLNAYDGGKRLEFANREAWMERLTQVEAKDA